MQFDRDHRPDTPRDNAVDVSSDFFAGPHGAEWLKSLRVQIPFVLGVCLLIAVSTYGWYNASRQAKIALDTLANEVSALARSLGESSSFHLLNNKITAIERLIIKGAANTKVNNITVFDAEGRTVSYVRRSSEGEIKVHFEDAPLEFPGGSEPQYILGTETVTAWHPIKLDKILGWVAVDASLDTIKTLRRENWTVALVSGGISFLLSLVGLYFLLMPRLRAFESLGNFALRLSTHRGATLPEKQGALELNRMANILTAVSVDLARQESELIKSEEQFRLLVEVLPLSLYRTDLEGRITFANKACLKTLGKSLDYVIGKTAKDFYPPELVKKYRADDDMVLRTGEIFKDIESHILPTTGKEIFVDVIKSPIFDADRKIIGIQGIFWDITERKRAEMALHDSEEQLKAIVDNSPNGITIKDVEGRFLLVNKTYAGWVNADVADIIGKSVFDFFPKTQAKEIHEADRQILSDNRITVKEVKMSFGGGVSRDLLNHKIPILIGTEQTPAVITIMTDLTEIKGTEDALRQSQKMEAVGQLTGGVAHDFNNLLAVINGNLELLGDTVRLKAEAKKMLNRAMEAVDKGGTLTDQLLTFSRQQTLNPKIGNANALIADMTRLLVRTLGEDIEIRTEFAEDLPPINVDPGLLGNAILNLANNARDAMPRGGILLIETSEVELDREFLKDDGVAASGAHVMITVSDAGSGMDEETLNHVFEPFYTTKGVGKGTGLGLAMVYGFVKQSGGYVTIDSEKGEGTTIRLYFPVAEDRPEDTEEKAASLKAEAKGMETIMVVEDDEDVRQVTVAILNRLGYKVVEAEDGPSALKFLGKDGKSVDLVFSDVIMPSGMSGHDLAHELRRHYQDIKVLMTSGYPEKIIDKDGIGETRITLLRKPYKKAKLAEAVRIALDQ